MSINLTDPIIEVTVKRHGEADKVFDLDFVKAHMFLERWAKDGAITKDDDTEEVPAFTRAFIAWVIKTYDAQITVGQAWKLIEHVRIEFLKLKKNYDQELSVVMNLEPTPSLSLKDKSISSPNQIQRVFRNSPDSEPSENSLTEE